MLFAASLAGNRGRIPGLVRSSGTEWGLLNEAYGIRAGFKELSVTDYEKILATNKTIPDLTGWACTVGLDYAELSDWAAVNLHFRSGTRRYDINHAWICLQSKTLSRVKAPWRDWAKAGDVTAVDDVSINPDTIAAYIQNAAAKYNLRMLGMDHYRWTLVSESLKKIGLMPGIKTGSNSSDHRTSCR